MRLMMRRMGHPADASHDYDYTDWDVVDRFGREVALLAGVASRCDERGQCSLSSA